MSVIVVHIFGEDQTYPLLAAPSCKEEDHLDWEMLIYNVINSWYNNNTHQKVGPLWSFATDGDVTCRKAGHKVLLQSMLTPSVKSGSSGLKSDGGNGREIEVSYRGGPEVRRRYESGDLVRTWRRLMYHALAKVVVLDFRGTEVQRFRGERRYEGGL